jgi:hypothetical protein
VEGQKLPIRREIGATVELVPRRIRDQVAFVEMYVIRTILPSWFLRVFCQNCGDIESATESRLRFPLKFEWL